MSYLDSKTDEGARGKFSSWLLPFPEEPAQGVDAPLEANFTHISRRMRWVRRGLSIFLVYHLLCVLLYPNSENYSGSRLSRLMTPYLNTFELTNAWNFFSPNPEPPIYIEFELLDSRGEAVSKGAWPEVKDPYWLRERQNRRITATDFMMASEVRTEKMMVPYLCHLAAKPNSVRVWRVMHTIAPIADVESGKRKIGDDVGADRKLVSHSFCEGVGA